MRQPKSIDSVRLLSVFISFQLFLTEKSGQCPKLESGMMGTCYQGCNNDWDCEGDSKCCSNGCGHVCKDPAETEGTVNLAR